MTVLKHLKQILIVGLACLTILPLAACAEEAPVLLQYSEDGAVIMPEEGEEVAVMTVKDYGEIVIRLFPEQAPKAVENFTELARQGYYDGLTFHRVIKDFMIQGGDPRGDGTGGKSFFGSEFEDEFSDSLYNFTGAVSMANVGPDTNGSQYFINEGSSSEISNELFEAIISSNKSNGTGRESFAENVKSVYEKVGGNPALDGSYTVFGQVVEGMDIVHQIASAPVHESSSTGEESVPDEEIIVESITIESYQAK